MHRQKPHSLLALLALTLWLAPGLSSQTQPIRYILRAPTPLVDGVLGRHGLTRRDVLRDGVEQILLVDGPTSLPDDAFEQEVGDDVDVVGFERDRRVVVPETPARVHLSQSSAAILETLPGRTLVDFFGVQTASTYASQPAGSVIRLPEARSLASGAGLVAIVDTGVDPNHPVLRGVLVPGFDFTRGTAGSASELADLSQSSAAILEQSSAAILEQTRVVTLNQATAAIVDPTTAAALEATPLPVAFGHGTMVAGLVHLVAPRARIMPLKTFHADGTSNVSDILRAIYYAADNGARVINMSFSLPDSSEELMRAVSYATTRNAICVASAGNEGREDLVYPAGYRNVIAVASTTNLDVRSSFSNYGSAVVTVAAPGEGVTTTYPGGRYAGVWGTSFSTALTSGGVALMVQVAPSLNASQAISDISAAKKVGQDLGEGRVDLVQAIQKSAKRK
ncbi:MAG: S8 family serine peptidase [Vicinamibacterales bacterium]